jgi:hypothetical protein
MTPCAHRGSPDGRHVEILLTLPGVTVERRHAVYACAIFGGCLPKLRCDANRKAAIGEDWLIDGEPAENVNECRGCDHREEVFQAHPAPLQ